LVRGYEVIGQEVVKVDANDVYVGLHFALYETIPDTVSVLAETPAPARRGRKPKALMVENEE